jgi:CRISPR-associated endonuclease/helicase Cas3
VNYDELFRKACDGRDPYPYQRRIALESLPNVMSVPTGLGKTAAVIVGWLWRRRFADKSTRSATPRRLVYCLPMRTLVEQTQQAAQAWLNRLGISDLGVHLLMGGTDAGDWDVHPERDAILIGTQDMLLSRALNRGYGMSRYRWPVHFALLNNDCLWVMDETQLMGVGLTTTAQLNGLRRKLNTYGTVHSLWMSATLDNERLNTVDHRPEDRNLEPFELSAAEKLDERIRRLLEAKKPLQHCELELNDATEKTYAAKLAEIAVIKHQLGSLTLLVINRVQRAQDIYRALQKRFKKESNAPECFLIHSRFRPCDREAAQSQALDEKSIPASGRIVVATQAIEAGVDLSARTLISELAPWSSLVQRFGRCNRRGSDGVDGNPSASVLWVNIRGKDDKAFQKLTLPYDPALLDSARGHLEQLSNVGPAALTAVEHQEEPPLVHVIRRKDLLDLWDTTPDLAGNDLDVSRYIRESEDTDLQVYWREWNEKEGPPVDPDAFPGPARDELCSVGIGRMVDFLTKLKKEGREAWKWNPLDRTWETIRPNEARPGMVLLLHCKAGGYDPLLGWTGEVKGGAVPEHRPSQALPREAMDEERTGEPEALLIHLEQVAQSAAAIRGSIGETLGDIPWDGIVTSARWHDVGKAHPAFQNALFPEEELPKRRSELWAKSGGRGRPRYRVLNGDDPRLSGQRIGFRHELASALAWLKLNPKHEQRDLIAFLIAAHHGKVRGSIRSLPNERPHPDPARRFARGIWEGDKLRPLLGYFEEPVELSLELMELGENDGQPSWLARVLRLRDEYGPFRLSYLESLLRVADWRASGGKDE